MALYTFICPACGDVAEVLAPAAQGPPPEVWCQQHKETVEMARDWKADNPGLGNIRELRNEREAGGSANAAKLFLPDNSEFAGPGDADGTKGMREWRDTHEPKAGNKRPHWPGKVERKVF